MKKIRRSANTIANMTVEKIKRGMSMMEAWDEVLDATNASPRVRNAASELVARKLHQTQEANHG